MKGRKDKGEKTGEEEIRLPEPVSSDKKVKGERRKEDEGNRGVSPARLRILTWE